MLATEAGIEPLSTISSVSSALRRAFQMFDL
jgi:hypothetical protein